MFASSKFGRKLPAIIITEQDAELLCRVNVELQQYINNMDHVKYVEFQWPLKQRVRQINRYILVLARYWHLLVLLN